MINIVNKKYWFFLLSAIIIIPGIISLAISGLKPGTDFQSGTTMTLNFQPAIEEGAFRQELAKLKYTDALVQKEANGDYIITLAGQITTDERVQLEQDLGTSLNTAVTISSYESVAPSVASQTVRNATIAVAVAAAGILVYITFAFRKMPRPLRWGTCAVIALVHDVLVVLGIFSILGWAAGVKIDALFITGMLTVAGYSVHDTIVVFDRIRENMSKRTGGDFSEVVNYSVVQTVVRSLNTSLTVIFVLLALFLLGGSTIHYFVLVLLIGVTTGTYSSIFNASSLLIVWENREWNQWFHSAPKAKVTGASN
jgi:preprotein translocase subunit SecF